MRSERQGAVRSVVNPHFVCCCEGDEYNGPFGGIINTGGPLVTLHSVLPTCFFGWGQVLEEGKLDGETGHSDRG